MRLTSTVVGSGQANRQDACQEKAVRSDWATTTSPQPTSRLWRAAGAETSRLGSGGTGQEVRPESSIHSIHWSCLRNQAWVSPQQHTVWNED